MNEVQVRADDPIAIERHSMLPGSTAEGRTKGKYFLGMILYKDVVNWSNVSKTRRKGHQSQLKDSY